MQALGDVAWWDNFTIIPRSHFVSGGRQVRGGNRADDVLARGLGAGIAIEKPMVVFLMLKDGKILRQYNLMLVDRGRLEQ